VDAQHGTESWLTLVQAAERLAVSIYTVRRQIKRGELEAQQVATRHGLTWLVRLSELPGDLPTVSSDPEQRGQGVDALELLRMLDQRDQTIMELAGRVGYLQAELSQARETIRALEAPRAGVESTDTASPAEPLSADMRANGAEPERPRGPWGRFLVWLYG
jgi:excisionase family DNA binding protein